MTPYKPTGKCLLASAVLGTLSSLYALPTLAQTGMLEEVIVTAQKREQNLQEVSISIAAFSGEAISELGLSNLEELTEHISGAELFDDRGAGQPTWVIRGVGLADFNSNNTPTAAIYYDDYYLPSNVLGGIGLFDIGQIEVLKGPQGGLYGRNSSGGAVRINSRRPTLDEGTNGYVTGSYGEWERYGVEAGFGATLSDSIAIRVSGMTDQDGGWQDSLATAGDDDHGDRDFSALRAQLVYQPSDTFDLWLKVETGQDKSETTLGYSRGMYDPNTGDFCDQAYAGSHDENNCVTLSNLTNLYALSPGDPGVLPSQQDSDGSTVMSKPINALDNDWTGVNLQMSWQFDAFTLMSISGYLDYDNNQVYDFDATELTLFEEDGSADLQSWSQEFRLISNGEGPLTWLVGAMYAEDEDDEDRLGDLRDNVLVFPTYARRGFKQETESWAVYGQAEYQMTDSWRVHASLRYTDETKDLNDAFFEDIPGGFYYIKDVNKSVDLDENWSGHIGVDWDVSDDVMVYARVTQGFKSGGFYGGFAFTAEELDPYKEEKVLSYEAGFKSTLMDGMLMFNGSAFYYDYQDVQGFTQVFSDVTGTVNTKLGNLGDAEHKGAELDVVWLSSGLPGLSMQASVAWLDAEISDSNTIGLDQAGVPVPIEGLTRGFAPEWSTALQLRYERNLTDQLASAFQLDYSWRDDLVDEDSSLTLLDVAAYDIESYGVLNARISLGAVDDSWSVALMGKNLTDEEYWVSTSSDDLGSYPSISARPIHWVVEGTYRW